MPRYPWQLVPLPLEGRVDDNALRDERSRVAIITRKIGGRVAHPVAEHLVAPVKLTGQSSGIGIDQELGGIEAEPALGLVRPVHTVAVELARSQIGDEAMPDEIGSLAEHDPFSLGASVRSVEETDIDASGVLAEEGEVYPGPVPRRAQGVGSSRPEKRFQMIHDRLRPAAP